MVRTSQEIDLEQIIPTNGLDDLSSPTPMLEKNIETAKVEYKPELQAMVKSFKENYVLKGKDNLPKNYKLTPTEFNAAIDNINKLLRKDVKKQGYDKKLSIKVEDIDIRNEETLGELFDIRSGFIKKVFIKRFTKNYLSREGAESLYADLVKNKKVRDYQLLMYVYTFTGMSLNDMYDPKLITMFEAVTGSGKTWIQSLILFTVERVLKDYKYFIGMSASPRNISVLNMIVKKLINESYDILRSTKTKADLNYDLSKFIKQATAGVVLSTSTVKSLSQDEKRKLKRLVEDGHFYVIKTPLYRPIPQSDAKKMKLDKGDIKAEQKEFDTAMKNKSEEEIEKAVAKNVEELRNFCKSHEKIISILSSYQFALGLRPLTHDIMSDREKIMMFDEVHSSLFLGTNAELGVYTYNMSVEQMNTPLNNSIIEATFYHGWRVSYFTGTPGYEQKRGFINKSDLDGGVRIDLSNFTQVFNPYDTSILDKLEVAINNTHVDYIKSFLDDYALEHEFVETQIKIGPNKYRAILKVQDVINYFSTKNRIKFINTMTKEEIKEYNKEPLIRKILLKSAILSINAIDPFRTYNLDEENWSLKNEFKSMLKNYVSSAMIRNRNNDGIMLTKIDKRNALQGIRKEEFIEIIAEMSETDPNIAEKTLIWDGEQACRFNNIDIDDLEFKDQALEDVVKEHKFKLVIINEKATTGISINNITDILILRIYKSANGEAIGLRQLLGRGVRDHEIGLRIGFIGIGYAETAALRFALEDQIIILPKEVKDFLTPALEKTIAQTKLFLNNDRAASIDKTYKSFCETTLVTQIKGMYQLAESLAGTYFNKDSLEFKLKVLENMTNSGTILSDIFERNMPDHITKLLNGNAIKKGGVHDSDIQFEVGDALVDIDFKFHTTIPHFDITSYKWKYPAANFALKGKDRSTGVLDLKNLYMTSNMVIDVENKKIKLEGFIVEFLTHKGSVTINELRNSITSPNKDMIVYSLSDIIIDI